MRLLARLTCLFVLVAGVTGFIGTVQALEVPPAPTLESPIVDQTNTLSPEEQSVLAGKINAERTKTSNQIAVLIVPTLDDTAIEDYSLQVARDWGIGEKDRNNGVLLLIAKNDRQLRIEVGYGLEGALPDARANQIIRNWISPEFKNGNYYQGISNGLDSILLAIRGEYDANLGSTSKTKDINWGDAIYFLLFTPVWLASMVARSKSWWAGGIIGGAIGGIGGGIFGGAIFAAIFGGIAFVLGLLLDWLVSRNYQQHKSNGSTPSWWAGGSGRSGGSFGGGSFGGGGSSGSW